MLYGLFLFFFFNDTATTEIYTLSLHDALPICGKRTTNRSERSVTRSPGETRGWACAPRQIPGFHPGYECPAEGSPVDLSPQFGEEPFFWGNFNNGMMRAASVTPPV